MTQWSGGAGHVDNSTSSQITNRNTYPVTDRIAVVLGYCVLIAMATLVVLTILDNRRKDNGSLDALTGPEIKAAVEKATRVTKKAIHEATGE